MYFMIGFQISKHLQIFFGSKSANMTQKTTKDIYMCGLYIPPITSNYFDPEIFEKLEKDILRINLPLGGLQLEDKNYSDSVGHDGHNIITNICLTLHFVPGDGTVMTTS